MEKRWIIAKHNVSIGEVWVLYFHQKYEFIEKDENTVTVIDETGKSNIFTSDLFYSKDIFSLHTKKDMQVNLGVEEDLNKNEKVIGTTILNKKWVLILLAAALINLLVSYFIRS
jgi:hypothetical protein